MDRDFGFISPMELSRRDKSNMGTGEIDPSVLDRGIKFRRVVKPRLGKIGSLLESAAREIGLINEAPFANEIVTEAIRPGVVGSP